MKSNSRGATGIRVPDCIFRLPSSLCTAQAQSLEAALIHLATVAFGPPKAWIFHRCRSISAPKTIDFGPKRCQKPSILVAKRSFSTLKGWLRPSRPLALRPCTISAWGSSSENSSPLPDLLRSVDTNLTSSSPKNSEIPCLGGLGIRQPGGKRFEKR